MVIPYNNGPDATLLAGDGSANVPAKACRFGGVAVTFADSAGDSIPIRMLARSAQPIDHWYWGRVVHDMAGMTLHKSRLPVDYVHDEPIGYLDMFDASNAGLVVAGVLVPTDDPADPARRLIARQKGGVPYEASINFGGDGIRYEVIYEGQSTEVNGFTFEGPGVVIREWPLRGVAVCPYGADMNTESQFSGGDAETFKASAIASRTPRAGLAGKLRFGKGLTPDAAPQTQTTPARGKRRGVTFGKAFNAFKPNGTAA